MIGPLFLSQKKFLPQIKQIGHCYPARPACQVRASSAVKGPEDVLYSNTFGFINLTDVSSILVKYLLSFILAKHVRSPINPLRQQGGQRQ
jgi:hypothetical protein